MRSGEREERGVLSEGEIKSITFYGFVSFTCLFLFFGIFHHNYFLLRAVSLFGFIASVLMSCKYIRISNPEACLLSICT